MSYRSDDGLSLGASLVAIALALLVYFSVYRCNSQPEAYERCRDSCAAKGLASWAWDPARSSCACGGATP